MIDKVRQFLIILHPIDKLFVDSRFSEMIGTDQLDTKILVLLKKKALHPSALAMKIAAGRTTITYRLNRLCKLGLITCSVVGRKTIYELNIGTQDSKQNIQIYTGKGIMDAYWKLTALPRQSVILQVQGRDAALAAFQNLPGYFIKKIHQAFKRKGAVLRCISNQESLEYFNTLDKSLVKSHVNRSFGAKILSKKFLASGEIISAKNLLLLTNPKKERIVVIKDKGITETVHDLLRLAFEFLDTIPTFDVSSFLNKNYLGKK